MHKAKFIFALGLFNAAIFLLVTLFLPRRGSFGFDGPVSYFINSRTDWHVAFGVLIASLLISWGIYLVVVSFQRPPQGDE
jgi:hypothetical protein